MVTMVTDRRPILEPESARGRDPTRNGQPSIAFDFTTDSIHPDCYAYATLFSLLHSPPTFPSTEATALSLV